MTHTNPTLLSSIVSLSLLGNHEEDSRTGLSGRGAAVGIGNVFSSLIHSVARNPSLAKQSFGYAILGFALTEAIASFASFFASKQLAFVDLIRIPIEGFVYIAPLSHKKVETPFVLLILASPF